MCDGAVPERSASRLQVRDVVCTKMSVADTGCDTVGMREQDAFGKPSGSRRVEQADWRVLELDRVRWPRPL